jgi:hypothetical protein
MYRACSAYDEFLHIDKRQPDVMYRGSIGSFTVSSSLISAVVLTLHRLPVETFQQVGCYSIDKIFDTGLEIGLTSVTDRQGMLNCLLHLGIRSHFWYIQV